MHVELPIFLFQLTYQHGQSDKVNDQEAEEEQGDYSFRDYFQFLLRLGRIVFTTRIYGGEECYEESCEDYGH